MPLLHCKDCHHEFEWNEIRSCDWCGGDSYVLEEETSFEKFMKILLKDPQKFFKGLTNAS